MPIDTGEKSAVISNCRKYRYALTRDWSAENKPAVWVMLNPSTADANEDDPTIRRIVEFSRTWGYSRAIVVNLFAYRATSPKDMKLAENPEGPDNQEFWENAFWQAHRHGGIVICAWGNHGSYMRQDRRFKTFCYEPRYHLGLTKQDQPKHPLYLPAETEPTYWPTPNDGEASEV